MIEVVAAYYLSVHGITMMTTTAATINRKEIRVVGCILDW